MSNYTEILDFNNLQQIVIVANTPMYLYKGFQRDTSVQVFSQQYTDADIIKIFYTEINNQKNLRTLTILYACILALSFKDSAHVEGFFALLKDQDIKWSKDIAEIYLSRVTIYNTTEFPAIITEVPTSISTKFNSEFLEFNLS